MATTPNKTKMSNMDMSQLRAFAIGLGFDPNQFPQYDDPSSSSSRVAFRKWIKDEMEKQGRGNELKIGHQISAPAPADPASPTPADPVPATSTPPPVNPPANSDQAATDAAQNSTNRWQWVGIAASILLGIFVLIFLFVMIRSINVQTLPGQFEAQATTIANQQKQIDALLTPPASAGTVDDSNSGADCSPLYFSDGSFASAPSSGLVFKSVDGEFSCNDGIWNPVPSAELLLPPTMDASATVEAPANDEPEVDVPTESDYFYPVKEWDWEKLDEMDEPTLEQVLEMHDLTSDMVLIPDLPIAPWEPALNVIELKPEYQGEVTIPLVEGFAYDLAPADANPILMWGGDAENAEITLQWGTSFRWVPSYINDPYGDWMDVEDPREWACRSYRFGRYLRNEEQSENRIDVPYYERIGPYYTETGNLDVQGWIPPALTENVPQDHMDACAMLGGRSYEDEWFIGTVDGETGDLVFGWEYRDKVDGSADYCPITEECWQTTYVPDGPGQVWLWHDGGVKKYGAEDRELLTNGNMNVDEFTYHFPMEEDSRD